VKVSGPLPPTLVELVVGSLNGVSELKLMLRWKADLECGWRVASALEFHNSNAATHETRDLCIAALLLFDIETFLPM